MNSNKKGPVLVVEDNWLIREYIEQTLREEGFVVISAADGVEALRIFERCASIIELVITDFNMPRLNGGRLCALLRKLRPDVPIILASAADTTEWRQANDAEFTAVLRKPLEREDLLGAVQQYHTSQVSHMSIGAT